MKRLIWFSLSVILVLALFGGATVFANGSYTVQRGDTLGSIAYNHGVTVNQLARANGLSWNEWVYVGQTLVIPGGSGYSSSATASQSTASGGAKWIDVNLSNQTLTAYSGNTPVFSTYISSGTWQYPTVTGSFAVYVKYQSTLMTGGSGADYYYIPDVPYTMYFYGGYALHGAYWHNNFGTPMSHGCVNLSVNDAAWLFDWTPIGTTVYVHY